LIDGVRSECYAEGHPQAAHSLESSCARINDCKSLTFHLGCTAALHLFKAFEKEKRTLVFLATSSITCVLLAKKSMDVDEDIVAALQSSGYMRALNHMHGT
jgi:hypothetical protein